MADAKDRAIGTVNDTTELFDGWKGGLLKSKIGPKACSANVLHALRNAPAFKGALRFDMFAMRIMVAQPLPWDREEQFELRQWRDGDDDLAAEWLQRNGIMVKPTDIGRAATEVARENGFDPLLDFLNALNWDCEGRLDKLPELFGVKITRYTSAGFRAMMISAVARAFRPGCKVDTVLTLEGSQGKKKSSAIEALFGKHWFTDDLAELGSKDAAMQMAGVWGIEIADLAAMKRADQDKIKAFITRKVDRFRPPYGKNIIEAPRRSIMISTTNLDDWNKDETGGRRYWPVLCHGVIDIARIMALRDQLWAEAVACCLADESWWLEDKVIIAEAQEEVSDRYAEDPWTRRIGQALNSPAVKLRGEITTDELLTALNIEAAKQTTREQGRIAAVLMRFGWTKHRPRIGPIGPDGKPTKLTVYRPPTDPDGGQRQL